MTELTRLRATRSRMATRLNYTIHWCLVAEAPYTDPNGLPSWWSFWSGVVVDDTRALVRAARELAKAEGREL